ncbi:unnamed protein product [Acanthoscelides obtectus]|uniref:Protein NATD1 n=1 Tax=Acanthoscelides obtectus TaxID=200917 RepID=A0A9P0PS91_ACAOB|nr:unnamed protein product [Acanthoscelides obtectus]CAK1659188.1 Protein NATD1 [Acanthoscelides obtectus]
MSNRFLSMKSNLINSSIINCSSKMMFKVPLDSSDNVATIRYEQIDENTFDLVHTDIPEELQGKGLGTILAERVFEHLANNNKKFKLTCEFLQSVYERKFCDRYSAFVIT